MYSEAWEGFPSKPSEGFDLPFCFVLFAFFIQDLMYPRLAFIILLPTPSRYRNYRHVLLVLVLTMLGSILRPHACMLRKYSTVSS